MLQLNFNLKLKLFDKVLDLISQLAATYTYALII